MGVVCVAWLASVEISVGSIEQTLKQRVPRRLVVISNLPQDRVERSDLEGVVIRRGDMVLTWSVRRVSFAIGAHRDGRVTRASAGRLATRVLKPSSRI